MISGLPIVRSPPLLSATTTTITTTAEAEAAAEAAAEAVAEAAVASATITAATNRIKWIQIEKNGEVSSPACRHAAGKKCHCGALLSSSVAMLLRYFQFPYRRGGIFGEIYRQMSALTAKSCSTLSQLALIIVIT